MCDGSGPREGRSLQLSCSSLPRMCILRSIENHITACLAPSFTTTHTGSDDVSDFTNARAAGS